MPVKGKGFSVFLTDTHLPHYYSRIKRDSAETDFSIPLALPVKHSIFLNKTSHKWPTCENPLDLHKAYGIGFESCSKCGGLWVHQKELRALKAKVEEDSWGNLRWMNDELAAIEKTSAIVSNKSCPECGDSRLLSTRKFRYYYRLVQPVPWRVA
jgi:ribosomal protein S27AE